MMENLMIGFASKKDMLAKFVLMMAIVMPVSASAATPRESIFFSAEDLETILQASEGNVESVADVDGEDEDGATTEEAKKEEPVDRGRRILTLSGIVYQSAQDWTVWLNGERVTPKNIPENVRGLVVQSDYIRLRWFDKANNRIVNITLRPHQHYNLDFDTISPGT